MPFTISHAIAGIAVHRLVVFKLSLSALVIGAMMPDAEYFLRMKMYGIYGHTLSGIFLFDLPLGLLCYFLFQYLIKYPLIMNCSPFFRQRFVHFLPQPVQMHAHYQPHDRSCPAINALQNGYSQQAIPMILMIIIALLIGILTHVVWDSFTHETGLFVQWMPALQQEISFLHTSLPLYKILQQISSLVGLLSIVGYIFFLPITITPLLPPASRHYQGLFLLLFMGIISVRLISNFTTQYGHLIVITLSAFFLSLFLTALIWQYRHRNHPQYCKAPQ